MSKLSKVTGLQGLKGGNSLAQNSSQVMASQANIYTMEELMRRVRRIEKLTDRMSHGQFESKRIAQQVIAGAQDGTLPQIMST